MTKYEFRAIPCPERALRSADIPAGADPFCETLAAAINDLAAEGWDYIRSETIEVKTRRFLRLRKQDRTFLVFRREARPLLENRPLLDPAGDIRKVRARRVKSEAVVEFVRGGGRRIQPDPANTEALAEPLVTAAE